MNEVFKMIIVDGVEIKVGCAEEYFFDSVGVTVKYRPMFYSTVCKQMVKITSERALQPNARAAIAYATRWTKDIYQIYD